MVDPESTLDPDAPTAPGSGLPRRIGPYRVDGLLGRGGMGEVFRAWDEALHRPVAVKRVAGARGAEGRARFWREARALAALDHPGVVRVHRIDETSEGDLFLAMELVAGLPLSALAAEPWPSPCVAAVGRQVAAALGAVHAARMAHRDVKPANLLIQPDGMVRLVDFGLARTAEGLEDRVTATGVRVGTPAYMAPEQVEGLQVGAPADVFSLGVVLYRLLAGVHPFVRDSESATALALAAAHHRPLSEAAPLADPALVAVVERCLAQAPANRWADGTALAAALAGVAAADAPALARFMAGHHVPEGAATSASSGPLAASVSGTREAPPRWRFAAGVVVVVAAAGLGWWSTPTAPTPIPAPPPLAAATLPALPPRPAVAVVGFAAPEDDPQDPRAAVLADAVRQALDQVPEALIALPLAALEGSLPPDQVVGPTLDPTLLVRPGHPAGSADLIVRGTLREADDGLSIEVELVDPPSGTVRRAFSVQGPADPMASGRAVALGLLSILEVDPPQNLVLPTGSVAAYSALLAERAALRRGDFEAAEQNLEWARQLDPAFVEAALDHLALLRARRALAEVVAGAEALLARADLTPRQRALASAWAALGAEAGPLALQRLEALLQRWPADITALELLMVLRTSDPELRDLAALEQVARRVLAIAPRNEEAASRLVRALAFRGRVAEAEAALTGLGIPADDPAFIEVFGELDLYAGRFDEAAHRFNTALARSPEDLYAEHMGFAADLLRGRCEAASAAALARIQRIEALGRDGNLDWTYSLACQALICRQQWPALAGVMDRWAAHSASGAAQVLALRPRVALAAGRPAAEVVPLAQAAADDAEGAVTLGRADPSAAAALAQAAEARAVAAETPGPARAAWLRAQRLLRVVAGGPPEDAPTDPATVRDEGALGGLVDALAVQAEALDRAGRAEEARAVWAQLAALGYPRLYRTDLWLLARQHLGGE